MVTECYNPSCRTKLLYLRNGRIIRVIHNEPDGLRIEHFWLCGACYLTYDFFFTKEDDHLSITPRNLRTETTHWSHNRNELGSTQDANRPARSVPL